MKYQLNGKNYKKLKVQIKKQIAGKKAEITERKNPKNRKEEPKETERKNPRKPHGKSKEKTRKKQG